MNNSGGDQHLARHGPELSSQQPNPPIALSRSVLRTEERSVPGLVYIGRLLSARGGAQDVAALRTKLLQEWKLSGLVNIWQVTDGGFLIQFYDRADLARVLDGAPWCCGGDDLFVLQRVRPDVVNLVDQVRFFVKAELWVKFHHVPVEYFSEASLYALAAHIGEPVKCPDVSFFRARIRVDVARPLVASIFVKLEDGECKSVSVEYEGIGSLLCGACRMLGHSAAAGRCSTGNQLPRQDWLHKFSRDKSRLSRSASSTAYRDDGGDSVGSSSSAGNQLTAPPAAAAAPPVERPASAMGVLPQTERVSAPNSRGLKYYFLKYLSSISSKNKDPAGEQMVCSPAENKEADAQSNRTQETVPAPSSPQQTDKEASVTASSHIQPSGDSNGLPNSSPINNTRIEENVETQSMESPLKEDLMALNDDNREEISSVGTQNDGNMGPVGQVAALVRETSSKSDSPTRFVKMVRNLLSENCCSMSPNEECLASDN